VFDRLRTAFASGPWWASWKLLVGLTALYAAGALVIAVAGIARVGQVGSDQGDAAGFAALAFTLFAFVAVVAFAAAAVFALLLYYEVAKPAVGVALIGAGLYVYRALGWFDGFLPLSLVAVISGGVALYEWAVAVGIDRPSA